MSKLGEVPSQSVFLCCNSLFPPAMAALILCHSKRLRHLTSDDFSRHKASDDFGRHVAGKSSEAIGCLSLCVTN